MIRGENSDSIPIDLVMEILSRLPAKSTARFRCVSKLWNDSVLSRPYFIELFMTRSSARPPRLLFAVNLFAHDWCFLTSPQPQNPYERWSSLVVTADFQMKFPGDHMLEFCGHGSGLIYFRQYTRISKEDIRTVDMICNPSTGQLASLPLPRGRRQCFLGFDPIDNQYKVLSVSLPYYGEKEEPDQILTLGTGKDSWREIHCPSEHYPGCKGDEGICIDGVLYYFARRIDYRLRFMIVCFDVRSEKFKFIDIDFSINQYDTKVINYKGKLGVLTLHRRGIIELCMWVIKDVEKTESEWSNCFSFCWDDQGVDCNYSSIVGVTATGDIIFSTWYWDESKPFYVFYLSPERNTLQSVEIKGFGANHFDNHSRRKSSRVKIFVDHVEDLKFIMTDAATSSIIPPAQKPSPTSTSTISTRGRANFT